MVIFSHYPPCLFLVRIFFSGRHIHCADGDNLVGLFASQRLVLIQHGSLGSRGLLPLGCFMLNADEDVRLAIVSLDHCDRGAHILLEPVDICAMLKPEGRIGVAQAVDGALVAVGVAFKPGGSEQGGEARPVLNGQPILMAEDKIIGIGPVAPLAQSIEVAMGVRLADHEAFPGLARYRERDPFAMLISVDIDVSPFEITGLAFPHAGIGHDQHIFAQKGAIAGNAGMLCLFGPATHEQIKLAIFLTRESRALVDDGLFVT